MGNEILRMELEDLKNPEAYFNFAKNLVEGHRMDFDLAIKYYSKVLELNPLYVQAYINRGALNAIPGADMMGAIADYTKAIELDPKNAEAYYVDRGWAKNRVDDFQGAIDDSSMAILSNSNNEYAYGIRGIAKAGMKDYDGAIADHTREIELTGLEGYGYFNRANARSASSDYRGAIDDLSIAISGPYDCYRFHMERGINYLKLGLEEKAQTDFFTAFEMEEEYTYRIASYYFQRDYLFEGENGKSEPKFTDEWRTLVGEKIENRDFMGVIEDINREISLHPEAETYCFRGSVNNCNGDYMGAQMDLTKAITLLPCADAYRIGESRDMVLKIFREQSTITRKH